MPDKEEGEDPYFMNHPEVAHLLEISLPNLLSESDRGAVLVGTSLVDTHLERLFEQLAPMSMTKKDRKTLLGYQGPLGTLSAKTSTAFTCRIITLELRNAIDSLRKIRNSVAHSLDSFQLSDHIGDLQKLFDLGPGIPSAINNWAIKMVIENVIHRLLHARDDKEPLFDSPAAVIQYLSENPHLYPPLEQQRLRWELGIGVALICGLIVYFRESTLKLVGDTNILVAVGRKIASQSSSEPAFG